ncbi:hypothetical protein ABQG13_17230, partial [Xanthomonas campestris]|uniref:hypothetical protein n=1 Tax=Xanthomonas campestris TaxID=339 RepID=UPI0032E4981F
GSSGTPLQTSRPCGRWVIGGFSGATIYQLLNAIAVVIRGGRSRSDSRNLSAVAANAAQAQDKPKPKKL